MEKSIIDLSPYLRENEKTLYKAHAVKSKLINLEVVFCALFWFLGIAGDCAIVGYVNQISTMGVANVSAWFLPFFIVLVVLHLVPLGMWVYSISARSMTNSEKWFVLTTKRVICISGGKLAVTSFVYLNDVVSVKAAKKYILVGLSQGQVFKVSGIGEQTESFAASLERVLDELFAEKSGYENGEESLDYAVSEAQNVTVDDSQAEQAEPAEKNEQNDVN